MIHQDSSLHRATKAIITKKVVENGKQKTIKSFTPVHQVPIHRNRMAYQTTSFKGVPPNLFSGSSRFVGQLQQGSLSLIKSATLKITVDCGESSSLLPCAYWFDRIDLKGQNGSKPLTSLFPDSMYLSYNLIEQQKSQRLKYLGNVNKSDPNILWSEDGNPIMSFRTGIQSFYLPLVGSIFGLSDVYFQNAVGDLNFEFYPRSTGINLDTSATNECLSIELITETEVLNPIDEQAHISHHSNSMTSTRFLEPIESHSYNVQLNNNQEKKFDLDSVIGDVSFIYVLISAVSVNNTPHKCVDIGDDGTVDVLTSSGKSLFGNGNPVPFAYLNSEVFNSHYSTDWNSTHKGIVIPFCTSIGGAHHGVKDNYLSMRGERNYISIKPDNSMWEDGLYNIKIYSFIHRTLASQGGRYTTSDDHS